MSQDKTTRANGYYWVVADDDGTPEVAFWDDSWHRCGWDWMDPDVEIKALHRQPLLPPLEVSQ